MPATTGLHKKPEEDITPELNSFHDACKKITDARELITNALRILSQEPCRNLERIERLVGILKSLNATGMLIL